MVLGMLVMVVSLIMVILAGRAIFMAFVKRKDERSKWIVIKSMADSFIIITILQTVLLVLKWVYNESYQQWWSNFKEGLYIEPVLLNFMILGIILIINTKKHGGSL